MRHLALILSLLFCFGVSAAMPSDVILGKVVSADPENGRVVVRIPNSEDSNPEGSENEITVDIPPNRVPEYVKIGSTVRIWGNYVKGNMTTFQGYRITGAGYSGGMRSDPTGVRSRIGRGRMGRGMFGRGGAGKGGGRNH